MSPDDLVVNAWGARFRGRKLPCAVGKGGISREKREGDGVTPAGIWRITGGMYRADRLSPPPGLGLIPSGHRDIWSDDPADSGYNLPARGRFSPFSHELMRRGDCLYDILLFTDHNQPATPGFGSAIFVHIWRGTRFPTAGCVAFRKQDLLWILQGWSSRSRLVIQE